ncbi:MAG: class F sortase [Chloroflexi bacterium]|nr:MAG: class F sortase [Chloroflexota bacterium]
MQFRKRTLSTFLLSLALLGAIIGGWIWYQSSGMRAGQGVSGTGPTIDAERANKQQLPHNLHSGARLVIPAIGVDAPVEPVGVQTNSTLAVPTKNQSAGVGWYAYGPFPGERGSAVVDGHLDRPGGSPAVFWDLHNLHEGDEVKVIDSNGKVFHFRVIRLATYSPTTAPLTSIFGNTDGFFLNLVTCAGDWILDQHQTSLRLVVYTQLVA